MTRPSILFLGDCVFPKGAECWFAFPEGLLGRDLTVVNHEGPIMDEQEAGEAIANRKRGIQLYSTVTGLKALSSVGPVAACLANNHAFDFGVPIESTQSRLDAVGIRPFGAGRDLTGASAVQVNMVGGRQLVLAAFGWEVIGCLPAGRGRSGVSPLIADHILSVAAETRLRHPEAVFAILMHWNYELDPLAQPAHRWLARRLILECEVDAVIGMHSHVVGPVERIGKGILAHSLGNFFLPQIRYPGGELRYPEKARRQLALELFPAAGNAGDWVVHEMEYRTSDHRLSLVRSGPLEGGTGLEVPMVCGMTDDAYARLRREQGSYSFGLPLFYESDPPWLIWAKEQWVGIRQAAISRAVEWGVYNRIRSMLRGEPWRAAPGNR